MGAVDTERAIKKPGPLFRTHIALTNEHGSWVLFLGPLLIGLFAGGRWTSASGFLVIAVTAGFLFRHPLTVLIKVYSGRRARHDIPAAAFWTAVYAVVGLVGLAGLIRSGHAYLFWLAVPGAPIFLWHLMLVSRRSERRQMGVEILASGVLALAAPAAFWIGAGFPNATGWWLWLLVWGQSAASIVYAYLRLNQRRWSAPLHLGERLRRAWRALGYATFNLVLVSVLGLVRLVPPLLVLPYALQWVETLWGSLNPASGVRPTAIGIRQLIVTLLFTLAFIIAWNL